jgi:hypothetical protein
MTAIDWQQIIVDGLQISAEYGDPWDYNVTGNVATLRVPQACPTCDVCRNGGYTDEVGEFVSISNPCPDCPTVAKLLAIGAAVMTDAIPAQPGFTPPQGQAWDWYIEGWNDATAALRAVDP